MIIVCIYDFAKANINWCILPTYHIVQNHQNSTSQILAYIKETWRTYQGINIWASFAQGDLVNKLLGPRTFIPVKFLAASLHIIFSVALPENLLTPFVPT